MQQRQAEALPLHPVWRQSADTDVPLFEAVHWVATKGGTVGFFPDAWNEAASMVVRAWRADKLKVTGTPADGRFPEAIDGAKVAGADIAPLYGNYHRVPFVVSTIEFWPRTDHESWYAKGFNDKFWAPEIGGWTICWSQNRMFIVSGRSHRRTRRSAARRADRRLTIGLH